MKGLTGREAKEIYVDKGYRGHDYTGNAQVHIVGTRKKKNMTRSLKIRNG